jgi:hypothetical protein
MIAQSLLTSTTKTMKKTTRAGSEVELQMVVCVGEVLHPFFYSGSMMVWRGNTWKPPKPTSVHRLGIARGGWAHLAAARVRPHPGGPCS